MSLRTDYGHYYVGSWIVKKEGDINVPLFVIEVEDPSDRRESDFSEAHRARLQFICDRYDLDARTGSYNQSRLSIGVLDESLVLESPDVGYVKVGNTIRWTHITPVRQRTKGITGHKIRQISVGQRQGQLMYNLFNPSFDGLINRYMYVSPTDGRMYYKGAFIGKVNNETRIITLLQQFQYLRNSMIAPEYPVYEFNMVRSLR